MAEGGREIETITIPDDPNDDWPSGWSSELKGRWKHMQRRWNQIFEDLGELLCKDNKDTLLSTIPQVEEGTWSVIGRRWKNADMGHSGQGNKRPGLPPSQAGFDPQRCGSPGASHRGAHQFGSFCNDKWGFGYLIGWFVGCTSCTLQTLYAWLMRGFWYLVWLESLFIGSYIYHLDVIAGTHAMLLI